MDPKVVAVIEVQAEYDKNPKHSLKRLLAQADLIGAQCIVKDEYEAALTISECKNCGIVLRATNDPHCSQCGEKIRAQAELEAITKNWDALHLELVAIDPGYKLIIAEKNYDRITIKFTRGENEYIIYREAVANRGYGRATKYGLRVRTFDYRLKFNGRKDFTKGLAQILHDKGQDLLDQMEAKSTREDEALKKKQDLDRKIIKAFPLISLKISSHYQRHGTSSAREIEFHVSAPTTDCSPDLTVITYDGDLYHVKGIRKGLTVIEIEALIAVIAK